jgi:hypothetical protein
MKALDAAPSQPDAPCLVLCRYYSAFHNVTAMVGAGVLGLPSAMSFLEWPGDEPLSVS